MPRIKPTHCLRNHEMTPENSSWSIGTSGKPQRKCRICHSLNQKRRYHEKVLNGWRKRKVPKICDKPLAPKCVSCETPDAATTH